jgi:TonB family protein
MRSIKINESYQLLHYCQTGKFLFYIYFKDLRMPSIKNVHFSFPCKEDINEMKPCDQGRHCASCSRTIIDFRKKSQEELDQLKKTNKYICGIFTEKQVAKGYESYFQLAAATVLAIGLSASFQNVHAQEETDPFKFPSTTQDSAKDNSIVGVLAFDTTEPEYPGGISAMIKFLKENLVYPADSVTGKVIVSFMVDPLGRTQHIKIKRSLSPLADAEVIRVVSLMVFEPGKENGRPVNSSLSLPISFVGETKE